MKYLLLLVVAAALFAGQARYARLGEFEGKVEVQLRAGDAWGAGERNVSLTDFPGRSTTLPPRHSSPLPPRTRISSTTRARRRPPPSSPGTDRAHGRGERTAMVIEIGRAHV